MLSNTGNSSLQTHAENQYHSENNKVNGVLKALPSGQAGVDNVGLSQFSSPSSRSLSPSTYVNILDLKHYHRVLECIGKRYSKPTPVLVQ